MNIFVSLIVFFAANTFACSFKADVKKIISLSGSTTVLLKETGLLNDPKIKGISVFNPVSEKSFKGKVYPGGLFIAQATLSDFSEAVVFYDSGEQLRKIISSRSNVKGVEVATRNLLPMESVELSVKLMAPFVSGCDEKFNSFVSGARKLQEKLLSLDLKNKKIIFYLGELRGERFPELVIANDGVVKLLRKEKKIESYPSELAYVNWSVRVMKSLSPDILHVGITDPGMKEEKEIKKSSQRMTLVYPGSLVPGYSQLEAFLYLFENLI